MLKKKKTTASGKPVMVISVHRTRSRRMKFCVQRGLGALPSTSAWGYLDSHRHRLPLLFANNIRILYTMIYFYYHSRNKYINYLHIST